MNSKQLLLSAAVVLLLLGVTHAQTISFDTFTDPGTTAVDFFNAI